MKAQEIYDKSMALMDEFKDSGGVDVNSTKDYKARSPELLNVLQNEVAMRLKLDYLDPISTLNGDIDLEDIICTAVMPYLLASRLLMQEDTNLSNYFANIADSFLTNYANSYKKKAKQVKRENVYGTMEVGD